jgi:CRISPR/Cas system-associated exonuclease Cas4 (RecB family)
VVPNNFTVVPAIDVAYHTKSENDPRNYKVIHPSTFGKCLRVQAYQYFGVKEERGFDAKAQRIFDCGHYMHARYKDIFTKAHEVWGLWKCKNPSCGHVHGEEGPRGMPLAAIKACQGCGHTVIPDGFEYQEVLCKDVESNIEGHADIIIRAGDGLNPEDFIVIDFKTINSKGFEDLSEPKHEHSIQVIIYMHILKIGWAIVFYEDKNNQNIKEFRLQYSPKAAEEIFSTARRLGEILKAGKIPPRPYSDATGYECRYCDFRKTCWG